MKNVRVMLVGIGIASFVMLLYNLVVFSVKSEFDGWVLLMSDKPPYIRIMGSSLSDNSMVFVSFFSALEQTLKVWEEYRK